MSFSYLDTAPQSSARSYIRLLLGDTSSGNAMLSDEEIDAFLSIEGGRDIAASHAADAIGATFARRVDRTIGKLKISMAQSSDHYFALGERLRFKAASRAAPYAGGISQSDKRDVEADTDRVKPGISIGFTDFDRSVDESVQ